MIRADRQRLIHGSGEDTEMVSIERQAGTMPLAETLPMVGFSPTTLPNIAGTRPDPAVSVPSANGTIPAATTTAEPEEEPPGHTRRVEHVARHAVGGAHADQPSRELV